MKLPPSNMRFSFLKRGEIRSVGLVICAVLILSGCKNAEERRASVIDALDAITESASGALSTARSGVESAVDAGKTVTDSVKAVKDDVTGRIDKVKRGKELINEGLGIGD